MCDECRQACLLATQAERIVAGHRKRDWLWVEDAQEDIVSRKAPMAMAVAGPSGWWRKLFTCKRQTRPEDEADESRHSEDTDEKPPKGLSDKQPLSARGASGVRCAPADEAGEGQGPGDSQELVGGGRADLRLLRKHIYDDNGEQVWSSRDASSRSRSEESFDRRQMYRVH